MKGIRLLSAYNIYAIPAKALKKTVSQGTVFLSAYHASTKVAKFTGKNQKLQLIILKAETIRKCFFEQTLFILEVAQHDGNSNQIYFRRIQKDTHV